MIVVEGWQFDKPKTRELLGSLGKLGLDDTKTLIVDSLENENLMLSARNVQRAKIVNSFGLNIYDLLYHEKLIISRAAAAELEDLLGPRGEKNEVVAASVEGPVAEAVAEPEEAQVTEPAKPKRTRKPKEEAT